MMSFRASTKQAEYKILRVYLMNAPLDRQLVAFGQISQIVANRLNGSPEANSSNLLQGLVHCRLIPR